MTAPDRRRTILRPETAQVLRAAREAMTVDRDEIRGLLGGPQVVPWHIERASTANQLDELIQTAERLLAEHERQGGEVATPAAIVVEGVSPRSASRAPSPRSPQQAP